MAETGAPPPRDDEYYALLGAIRSAPSYAALVPLEDELSPWRLDLRSPHLRTRVRAHILIEAFDAACARLLGPPQGK